MASVSQAAVRSKMPLAALAFVVLPVALLAACAPTPPPPPRTAPDYVAPPPPPTVMVPRARG